MIRLNISVFLSLLFYVNFMNSSPNSDELLKMYKSKLRYSRRIVQDKEEFYLEYEPYSKYDICSTPIEVRSAICRLVIRRLRMRDGYSNLYMNYLAFTVGEPCKTVEVWINEGKVLANQQVLNCFGSSAVMSLGSPQKIVQFYRKIVIHPFNTQNLWVFEYNEDENYYVVVRLHEIKWTKIDNTISLLFSTPIPQGWRDVPYLYSILSPIYSKLSEYSVNEDNILNLKSNETLFKICYVVLKSENDDKQLNYKYENYKKPQSSKLLAVLQEPFRASSKKTHISAYSCEKAVADNEIFMRKYYVAAGPGDHSVILLEEMESSNSNSPSYKIIDFVKYITKIYLHFCFQGLY